MFLLITLLLTVLDLGSLQPEYQFLEGSIVRACLDTPATMMLEPAECALNNENSIGETKWTFDHISGKCESFQVNPDCEISSRNIFSTSAECDNQCLFGKCFVRPLVQPCDHRASGEAWFYADGSCMQYPLPNSCPTGPNHFPSEMECYANCSKAFCILSPEQRSCPMSATRGMFQRWFMNVTTGECEHFSFPDCEVQQQAPASLNNFLTQQECKDICYCDEISTKQVTCQREGVVVGSDLVAETNVNVNPTRRLSQRNLKPNSEEKKGLSEGFTTSSRKTHSSTKRSPRETKVAQMPTLDKKEALSQVGGSATQKKAFIAVIAQLILFNVLFSYYDQLK